jgi:predicted Zn-dependent protease with MMP-like domain
MDTQMDIQRREKRIEKLIRNEEIEEAMNKLPINERAIIKEVLVRIKSDNHRMFLDKLTREHNEKISEFGRLQEEQIERENERRECSLMVNVCIMCAGAVGTVAYVGLALMK